MATCEPIGYLHCPQRYRYEAPRQGVLAALEGEVRLLAHDDYRLALRGLEGFDRIWLLCEFHLNETWQALVQPPRTDVGRVGVFATRSPHRPNRLGLSCVELRGISDLTLRVRGHDLLDGTPVLDIKPYLPYADAFPDARAGWAAGDLEAQRFAIEFAPAFNAKAAWLARHGGLDARNFAEVQLAFDPRDTNRKRLTPPADDAGTWGIAYRTWRLTFTVDEAARQVTVRDLHSGYRADELERPPDPHADKAVHAAFREHFGPESDLPG